MKNKLKFYGIIVIAALVMLGLTACELFEEDGDDKVAVSGVTLNSATASVTVGGKVTLTATISPNNATNKDLNWSSSSTAIATVSASGEVTGVAPGSTVIVVTTVDGGHIATCTVTVSPALTQVAQPNGNGGVSVDADGNLKITADLWLLYAREENQELKEAGSTFNRPVRAYLGERYWDFPEGIKEGRLDILFDSSKIIADTDLRTADEDFKQYQVKSNLEGGGVRFGGLSFVVRETVQSQDDHAEIMLTLLENISLRQDPQLNDGKPFYYFDDWYSFIFSMGDISFQGSTTNEYSDETQEFHTNYRFVSGWNIISQSLTNTTPQVTTWALSSKSPSATGTRWVLAGSTDDDE